MSSVKQELSMEEMNQDFEDEEKVKSQLIEEKQKLESEKGEIHS